MRFKKEKYIEQRQTKSAGWSFRVRIGDIRKTFNEIDYSSPQIAFQKAKSYRDQVLYEMSNDTFFRQDDITLEEALEESYKTEQVAFETRRKHESFFHRYIGHEDMPLKNVTKAFIVSNLNSLVSTLSDDGLLRVLSVWKRIYRNALINDRVQRDLTAGIVLPRSRVILKEKNKKMTDADTLMKAIESVRRHVSDPFENEQMGMMLMVLYYTGMRPAELFALQKSDYRKGTLNINKQIGSNETTNYVVTIPKTTDSIRTIPLNKEAREIIEKAIKMSDSQFIFPRSNGQPHNSREFNGKLQHSCRADGIEFNPYQLRHLFANEMELMGVDRRTQQELLGHSSYSMTLSYQRSDEQRKMEAMQRKKPLEASDPSLKSDMQQ